MKRHILIPSISILFFFNGCTILDSNRSAEPTNINQNESSSDKKQVDPDSIQINRQAQGKIGEFNIGMKMDQLTSMDLYNTENEITQINVIQDNNDSWDYGNTAIWTPNMCFLFDTSKNLYQIIVNGDVSTSLGLKNGDPLERVIDIYGNSDSTYKENIADLIKEYKYGDYYFFVDLTEDKVSLWGISKYPYDYDGKD